MIKKNISKIVLGVFLWVAILAAGFYFFVFANPMHLHQTNLLKWIPILLCFTALYASLTTKCANADSPACYALRSYTSATDLIFSSFHH